jgi:hypothetical protein
VAVAGRKGDQAPWPAVLLDTLHDARALTCEAFGRKNIIRFLRHYCPDVLERTGEARTPGPARIALLKMCAVGCRDLEVEVDFYEPIVG